MKICLGLILKGLTLMVNTLKGCLQILVKLQFGLLRPCTLLVILVLFLICMPNLKPLRKSTEFRLKHYLHILMHNVLPLRLMIFVLRCQICLLQKILLIPESLSLKCQKQLMVSQRTTLRNWHKRVLA